MIKRNLGVFAASESRMATNVVFAIDRRRTNPEGCHARDTMPRGNFFETRVIEYQNGGASSRD